MSETLMLPSKNRYPFDWDCLKSPIDKKNEDLRLRKMTNVGGKYVKNLEVVWPDD